MSNHNLPNKTTALALGQKVIAGVDKYFAKVKTLTLAGTVYTPKALKAVMQADIDATRSLDEAKAQLRQQVATADALRTKAHDARKLLRAYVLGNFGATAVAMLQDFGMSVPRPGQKTAIVKAAAVAKSAATRKANKATTVTTVEPTVHPAPAATNAS